MRHLILCAGALFLAGCDIEDFGGSDRYSEDFHYNYPLQPGGRVSLENFNGTVEISGWDQAKVDISGAKYASTPETRDAIKIEVTPSSDAVTIRTVRPSQSRNAGARYVVKVPRRMQLERIISSNGSLRVTDVEGAARLKTSNGSLRALRLSGPLDATTSNSSIELEDIKGDCTVKTSNGRLKAQGVRGSIDASTSNGSVDITADELRSSGMRVSTSNGSITLRLHGAVNARLIARTSNSSIATDFEIAQQSHTDKHHLEGVIGSGGPVLDLSTSNGNIRVVRQ